MIYLLSGILTGGVLTAICWPLFSRKDTIEAAVLEETEWDLLERRKEVVLGNIQDLDFEYKCRKLSDADYGRLRAELASELARIYEEIDRIEQDQDLDALIRTEVARRRTVGVAAADIPERVACAKCGHVNPSSGKFCGECGARLG
jgi:hypothetical protein